MKKVLTDYDFILVITHMTTINNWFEKVITVTKHNGVSKIE